MATGETIEPFDHAVRVIRQACDVAGNWVLIDDMRDHLASSGIAGAIAAHDTQVLFGWLMEVLSYQGISDRIASGFMEKHGAPDAAPIAAALASGPSCPKLRSYWHFERCGFHKGSRTCAE